VILLEEEFKHVDSRRTLYQLLTRDIKQVNLYEAKKGAILGNHFHKETDEYFYLISGKIYYNESRILEPGDLFVVFPEENHVLECCTDVKLMSFLTKAYSKENPDQWQIESS